MVIVTDRSRIHKENCARVYTLAQQGMTLKEIAEQEKIHSGTVRKRIRDHERRLRWLAKQVGIEPVAKKVE